jgi:hypothetical protein
VTTIVTAVEVPVLPAASVAAHVTVVEPTRNVEPEAGEHVTVPTELVSVAVGSAKVITAPPVEVASTVCAAGAFTTGAVRSMVGPDPDAAAEVSARSTALIWYVDAPSVKVLLTVTEAE